MVYAVSPSGYVYEVRDGYSWVRHEHWVVVNDRLGKKVKTFPACYHLEHWPPYESIRGNITSEQLIRFVRECDAYDVAKLKKYLRQFNAKALLWDDE